MSHEEAFMTARDFLMNITIILTVMAVGALIETAVPMFAAKACGGRRTGKMPASKVW